MHNLNERVFKELYPDANGLAPERWLSQEVTELALTYDGLDDMPLPSIYPLGYLSLNGATDSTDIAKSLQMEESDVLDYLEFLVSYRFVQECNLTGDYKLTHKGEDAYSAIGRNIIKRKRFELKRQYESIEAIYNNMDQF